MAGNNSGNNRNFNKSSDSRSDSRNNSRNDSRKKTDSYTRKTGNTSEKVKHFGAESPRTERPRTERPKTERPKIERSKVERPKTERPRIERPKTDRPKIEHPKIENNEAESPEVENLQIEGRNAVLEAINKGRHIDRLLVKSGDKEGTIRVIIAKAREAGIIVTEAAKEKLDAMGQSGNHQGVIAVCPAHEYVEVEDIISRAAALGEDPLIIILDSITDPHNLGAIIRSAEAAGAHGIIIPKRRAVGITAIAAKAAAGAAEYLPVARVTNISVVIDDLKKQGIWVCAADMDGQSLYDTSLNLAGPLAVVVGGEGYGVGRLIAEKCDFSVKIPMHGKISSLNASVAAALIIFEITRRRGLLTL